MTRVPATEARDAFAETLNRVAYRGERIVLHRHGKNMAALIPIEDLELLEQIEDRLDLEAARKALKERGRVAWAQLKKDLGL